MQHAQVLQPRLDPRARRRGRDRRGVVGAQASHSRTSASTTGPRAFPRAGPGAPRPAWRPRARSGRPGACAPPPGSAHGARSSSSSRSAPTARGRRARAGVPAARPPRARRRTCRCARRSGAARRRSRCPPGPPGCGTRRWGSAGRGTTRRCSRLGAACARAARSRGRARGSSPRIRSVAGVQPVHQSTEVLGGGRRAERPALQHREAHARAARRGAGCAARARATRGSRWSRRARAGSRLATTTASSCS